MIDRTGGPGVVVAAPRVATRVGRQVTQGSGQRVGGGAPHPPGAHSTLRDSRLPSGGALGGLALPRPPTPCGPARAGPHFRALDQTVRAAFLHERP